MKKISLITKSPLETKKIGAILAQTILSTKNLNTAFLIGLKGDLGSGKTTFVKGFAKGLQIKKQIQSPTFIIFKKYKLKNKKYENFYHIDAYRLKTKKDLETTKILDIIKNNKVILVIEWINLIKKYLPLKKMVIVDFKNIGLNLRKIKIEIK
jgi:tRNA threonylcarbamoyladenosine biosynthesis protein TsaE